MLTYVQEWRRYQHLYSWLRLVVYIIIMISHEHRDLSNHRKSPANNKGNIKAPPKGSFVMRSHRPDGKPTATGAFPSHKCTTLNKVLSHLILSHKVSNAGRRLSSSILTHWGRVTHICVGNLTIIGSDNGLSPGRRQAIIRTNAGILLIGPMGTNSSKILIEILTFSLKKMRLKVSSAKRWPFCLGLNVLRYLLLCCWCQNIPQNLSK